MLRIYEINEEISVNDIVPASSRIDHILPPERTVTIKKPVVTDEEFREIKTLLVESVSKYRL